MIEIYRENDFELDNSAFAKAWITQTIVDEGKELGEVNYIFCDDDYLHRINVDFLEHDTLTDIVSFDYTQGNRVSGDIYISTERVVDNAKDFEVSFLDELHRVMVHGILHYCGYKDKSETDAKTMRSKENEYLAKRSL